MAKGSRLERLGPPRSIGWRRWIEALSYPVAFCLFLLLAWEGAVRWLQIPERLLPPPSGVLEAGVGHVSLLWLHGLDTVRATLLGFGASVVIGTALAVVLTHIPWLHAAIFPLLVVSQTVPKVAIAPLLLIWFGFGIKSKVLVAFLIAFFPIVIDTMLGFRSVPPEMILLARSMGASELSIFRKFRFPYALPYIFGGLRIAVIFAITGTVVAEFVGSDTGLVYLLLIAQAQYQTGLLFAILLILSTLGVVLFGLMEFLERRLIPWSSWSRAAHQ